jgi:hypothetical protein
MTEQVQPEVQQEQPEVPNLVNLLKDFTGAPGQTEIEKWKQQFGEIFVSGFSETELFVWRPLGRQEYVTLQKKMRAPKEGEEPMTDLDFEEAVVDACILWGSAMEALKHKGGSVSTLSEQIMTNSNFMAPAMASVLVMKL